MSLPAYEVQSVISRSAHWMLQRAVRCSDGRAVILKRLAETYASLETVRQLEFEYHVLGKLRLPHVIEALELADDAGRPVLVLEDFGAENLELPAAQRLPLDEFYPVALQAARALGEIHARGVIHKDIKPANLVLNRESGLLKLIDFHLATELSRESQELDTQRLEGSLPYMSPEQTGRMNRSLDYRTDYYSLGVTFYRLLTGRLPFEAGDVMGWVHAHISRQPLEMGAISGTPPMLSRIVMKLMAKDADARYQSARGLIHDLERCRLAPAHEPFELGARDVSERFQISERLVGREQEVAALLALFEQASRGKARLALIQGHSGVGKSALIRELHVPIVALNGSFVSGKFDQLDRNIPYGALGQAARQLIRRALTASEEGLKLWRERLLAGFGSNARVMTDWLPELAAVIGPQPDAPALNPSEAQRRFHHLFAELLRVFARPEHPLVLFLDDLQWSDASTPDLLAHLFAAEDIEHLLVIGAYRDNEVEQGHLLELALRRIREARPEVVEPIEVRPLSLASITALCADSLRRPTDGSAPLAELVWAKTEGNPFFATELLAALHRSGAIRLDQEQGSWHYDLDAVRAARVSDNVVDLMLARLDGLSAECRQALSVAACVNNQFELATLAQLLEQTPDHTARLLWEAIARGLLVPRGDGYRLARGSLEGFSPGAADELDASYRFQHDRVQQACYSLIAEEDRAAVHLRIGRKLLSDDEPTFEVVNHLNIGRSLITTPAEREVLVRLNRAAAARAKRSTAYAIASSYLDIAIELYDPQRWSTEIGERFELIAELAECVLMAGDAEGARRLCAELFDLAPDRVRRGAAHLLEAKILEAEARFSESVSSVRAGLELFGIIWPAELDAIGERIGAGIARMQAHLARQAPERLLELPDLVDAEQRMAMNLLFQAIPAAIQTCPPLFILAELIMFDIGVEHGLTPMSAKNLVDCGIIQGGMLGDYATAYRLAQVAFGVLERYDARAIASGVYFVFGTYVSSWRAPHREALDALVECYRVGMETGDVQHMGFGAALRMHRLLHVGHDLRDCGRELASAIAFLERSRLPSQRTAVVLVERALAKLCDEAASASQIAADDAQATTRVLESKNPQWIYAYAQSQMSVSLILGDLDEAETWRQLVEPHVPSAIGLVSVPEFHLGEALLWARRAWPASDPAERAEILTRMRQVRDKLETWSKHCAANFAHKYHLVAAELARLEGEPLESVLAHYHDAIEATGTAYVQWRALALELQARFWQQRLGQQGKQHGGARVARALLQEAQELYARWGARRKVARLAPEVVEAARDYPLADTGGTPGAAASSSGAFWSRALPGEALDLGAVLKATRAIAQEVRSDALFASLMATLLENAAAERGCLIRYDEAGKAARIEAEASVVSPPVVGSRALIGSGAVCEGVVQLAARSREPIVIDNASDDPQWQSDPFVRSRALKSVLCLPILHQGRLVAAFYAENNATARAFTPARLATLRLIAGHAAISIANAELYAHLEARVAERTRELADKNREIGAMLDALDQGVFSIDDNLCIQPRHSRQLARLLGTDELSGRPFAPLLFAGSTVGADARAGTEMALQFSFGVRPALASLNDAHLVREFSRRDASGAMRELEVDWNPIIGEAGTIDKFLVVVRDATVVRQLRAEQGRHVWEVELVSQIIAAGIDEYREFCAASRTVLELGRSLRARPGQPREEDARQLFRELHTLKGNARAFGASHLVEAAHAAETLLERRSDAAAGPGVWAELYLKLDSIEAGLDRLEEVAHSRLGPLWAGESNRLEIAIDEIEGVLAETRAGEREASPALAAIARVVRGVRSVSLPVLLQDVTRSLRSVAAELGKPNPHFECRVPAVSLTTEWARVMREVFTHILSNALDHGIEPSSERQAQGKDPRGLIQVFAERHAGGLQIRLADDGRGLALGRLRQTAAEGTSDELLAESIFNQGVTTANQVSVISGRGVGMDAVRTALHERGGSVRIALTGNEQAGHRPFDLTIDLPAEALLE
jgi:predicted ATPase/GAF domain-containing protein/HPt (histidine-containing phosphotransfer) domain-containing protein